MGKNVTLEEMLAARENRALRQTQLIKQYGMPLISFTMNIAGPVKNSPLIRRGFEEGRRLLSGQLLRIGKKTEYTEEIFESTGCEGFYVVDHDAKSLKRITCLIEDHAPLGRLFDMDVIDTDGVKLDRSEPRKCLICERPAKECSRSRRHSVQELADATETILVEASDSADCRRAAELAVRALLYEVCITPKPGLVDRENSGSHSDMDIYTFMTSASVLQSYFRKCAAVGRKTSDLPASETFRQLRSIGMIAEGDMLSATGGVNVHKGAIFSLGTVCGALGRLERSSWKMSEIIMAEVSAMTKDAMEKDLSDISNYGARTRGESFYIEHGISGVRGQIKDGFPAVTGHGLPVLEKALSDGRGNDAAGCAALLAILADTEDTNMITRGGFELYSNIKKCIGDMISSDALLSYEKLRELDQYFIEKNLSPGGSADLMALCWMLHFLKEA